MRLRPPFIRLQMIRITSTAKSSSGRGKVKTISVLRDYGAFANEVNCLHKEIEAALERRLGEYVAAGLDVPQRIKFEELDLRHFMARMLSVHKTLQSNVHYSVLRLFSQEARKARTVAIAGICELVKEGFLGKFWDTYQKFIGWGPDTTVYDWIWEKGFQDLGIALVRSEYIREFVQTLVLESGVPKKSISDIVNFFILYWRYLSNNPDVERLI